MIRYRSDFEYATQRPSGISALLLRPYWSVIWRVSLWWIAFTLLGLVVTLRYFFVLPIATMGSALAAFVAWVVLA